MDADATAAAPGHVTFTNTNRRLIEAVYELLVSLGAKATIGNDRNAYGPFWHVRSACPFNPFALPRKVRQWDKDLETMTIRRHGRTIDHVEILEETEHMCIEVDAPSHLWLAGKGMIPTLNSEMASSERHRDTVWDFWNSVAFGRLQPWTVVLVIGVRWREDDFIGRLMSEDYEGNPSDWRYIRIPAVCDSESDPLGRKIGEALIRPQADQSQEEAQAEMKFVKSSISTYAWNTMWQMNPVDPEGTIFFEKHWRYWGGDAGYKLPKPSDFDQFCMSWDMTYKDKKDNDWVVGQFWGGVGADRYLIDQVRGHWGFTETCAKVKSFANKCRYTYPKVTAVVIEGKANGPAVMDSIRSSVGGLIEFDPRDYGDKTQRAWACQPLLLGGNLYAPAPSERPWVRDYIKEMSDFPRAVHDDCVDSTTQALLWMQKYKFSPSTLITATSTDLQNVRALGGFTHRR